MPTTALAHSRLFLALWPDDPARAGLAQWRDRWTWPAGASPTPTERLHLTLHFIGSVAAGRMDELATGLAVSWSAFALEFGRAELWPGGIAVVCPHEQPAALQQLHSDLAAALGRLALPADPRPLRAHVTMGRRARGAAIPTDGPELRWDVNDGYALVESMAGGQGYRLLRRFR